MPTSDYHQIPDVMHLVDQIAPRSILEIGIGFGKWGVLCRELLEIGHAQILDSTKWRTRIVGIDIFPHYRNPNWEFAYNETHIADAGAYLGGQNSGAYDLILCCDVIEHLEKEEGRKLLEQMLKVGKVVILTSPIDFAPQGEVFGNTHEVHKSGWNEEDFSSIPHLYKPVVCTFVAALSSDAQAIRKLRLRTPLESLGFKKGSVALAKLFVERLKLRIA